MAETLEQALADEREDLQVLRQKGFTQEADMLERTIERLARAAAPYLDWLSEKEAVLRSAHSVEWLRARYPVLEAQGLARRNPHNARERQYLRVAVPQRANVSAAREAGARGERLRA